MTTICRSALTLLLAAIPLACSRESAQQSGPSYTQQGSSADQSRGAQSGRAPADCNDLPSAADLKKWLRDAPREGGEAGGLFSGQREWAAIVNRQGVICATAVAMDDA